MAHAGGHRGEPQATLAWKTSEELAQAVIARHGLCSLHLFVGPSGWRVFGARGNESFKQSVEEGGGDSIANALLNLSARLDADPIQANVIAPLPRLQAPEGSGS